MDILDEKKEPESKRPKSAKYRRPGPKSITRPNEPKAVPTFEKGIIFMTLFLWS